VRIPGWAQDQVVPGDLYRFDHSQASDVQLKVNGTSQGVEFDKGYATITRVWRKGDSVELDLPMPVRRVFANQLVAADRGRVALERGPIVYAAEWADSPDKHVRNILLSDNENLKAEYKPDLLNGVEVIEGIVEGYRYGAKHELQHNREAFTAIPYYAWANRGRGQMEVWIANSETALHPVHYPTIATESVVAASGNNVTSNGIKDPKLVADDEDPSSSSDTTSYYDWYPRKGTEEWIQYDFGKPKKISASQVYWFAERERGQVKTPASWRLLYKDGAEWKPVETTDPYGVSLDEFNRVRFKPVETQALRLELQLQPDTSAGLEEWRVQ
jgi:hypothetical protein